MIKSAKLPYGSKEIELIEHNIFTEKQMSIINRITPKEELYEKTSLDGKKYSYVKGFYVKKILNMLFGFDWSEEVTSKSYDRDLKQVTVSVKLTIKTKSGVVFKEQFGGSLVEKSLPDAFKSATTDALKKCASEFGLFYDVYSSSEDAVSPSVKMTSEEKKEHIISLVEKLKNKKISINQTDEDFLERIIKEKETGSYDKAIFLITKKLKSK